MRQHFEEVLRVGILSAVLLALFQTFLVLGIVPVCRVTSESMEPTIAAGSRLFVDRTTFWWREPGRWETVVLACPDRPAELCVKRIVGLPGERVQIRSPAVWIDGKALTPPHGRAFGPAPGQDWGDSDEYTLGPEEYFVLGDNSAVSVDSRVWRPAGILRSFLVGRPILPGMGSGRQPTE